MEANGGFNESAAQKRESAQKVAGCRLLVAGECPLFTSNT